MGLQNNNIVLNIYNKQNQNLYNNKNQLFPAMNNNLYKDNIRQPQQINNINNNYTRQNLPKK